MNGGRGEAPVEPEPEHPDGRSLWEWKTKYEAALPQIRLEAIILGSYLGVFGLTTLVLFAFRQDLQLGEWDDGSALFLLERKDLLAFFVGTMGAVTFAIKWLVHSVANGLWHQDRFLWRVFIPLTGGIYALIVLALLRAGFMSGTGAVEAPDTLVKDLVIAFLAGHFADGVSGLLTNVANAIFGKVDKK